MAKEKNKEGKKRAYRIIIITIAFAMIGSTFAWLAVAQTINKIAIIIIASVLLVLYIATIIVAEISYSKRTKEAK